jgi:hypothetical protein
VKLTTLVAVSALALVGGKLLIDRSTQSSADGLQRLLPAQPTQPARPTAPARASGSALSALSPPTAESLFQCDGRRRCPEMRSCAEARFYLANCPGTKMDGDDDGIPCEDQHCTNKACRTAATRSLRIQFAAQAP